MNFSLMRQSASPRIQAFHSLFDACNLRTTSIPSPLVGDGASNPFILRLLICSFDTGIPSLMECCASVGTCSNGFGINKIPFAAANDRPRRELPLAAPFAAQRSALLKRSLYCEDSCSAVRGGVGGAGPDGPDGVKTRRTAGPTLGDDGGPMSLSVSAKSCSRYASDQVSRLAGLCAIGDSCGGGVQGSRVARWTGKRESPLLTRFVISRALNYVTLACGVALPRITTNKRKAACTRAKLQLQRPPKWTVLGRRRLARFSLSDADHVVDGVLVRYNNW
jgi:hypothetical protein